MPKLLTKSKYLLGLQCPRWLWVAMNDPSRLPPTDDAIQYKFDEGSKVGELAQSLFPGGVDCQVEGFMESIAKSKSMLGSGKVLFEAGFMAGRCYSRADMLVPVDGMWDIIEVKMGTSVKDINVEDVAFQKFCYINSGLKIRKCFLLHINNEYVREGEIDVQRLFVKEDITAQVDAIKDIPERVKALLKIIDGEEPSSNIGKHCSDPYECELMPECWKFEKGNVFELYNSRGKQFELFSDDILSLGDIPDDFKLTANQQVQKECALSNAAHIDKEKIKGWLDSLQYPLYYLDFETYNTAIPLYDGLRPYQRIPFQFSLHIVTKEGVEHKMYLGSSGDTRAEFISELKKVLGDKGSIITFNQAFEISVIREMASMFPSYKDWSENVIKRVVDLLVPFRNFWYYHPSQCGSASIKKVLPALTGKSYSDLEISDGGSASLSYIQMVHGGISKEEVEKIRKDLEVYCGLDTEGMIWIVDKLKELVL